MVAFLKKIAVFFFATYNFMSYQLGSGALQKTTTVCSNKIANNYWKRLRKISLFVNGMKKINHLPKLKAEGNN